MNNPLVGKTIAGIQISNDRQELKFSMSDGTNKIVPVDADCCSYTWIESVALPAHGFPATVLSVAELKLPENTSNFHKDADFLQFYGCKIVTDRGEIIIDFRNDSNGYYGGDLYWGFSGEKKSIKWCDNLEAP